MGGRLVTMAGWPEERTSNGITTTPELVVLDFDGTLAHRPGLWSQCMVDVLDVHRPGHSVSAAQIRPHLRNGFPWHRPESTHPELNETEAWWTAIGTLVAGAFAAVGVTADDALCAAVRAHYCDPSQFRLYSDTIPALELLSSAGIRMAILSNHVPELASIVTHHGLDLFVDDVITSACIGVEKPHPAAFRAALGDVKPDRAWMIGDNPVADIEGAANVGMHAVLVRHADAADTDLLSSARSLLR